ncbi:MAG: flagellar assembly protein FliX [Alphaproteobacteria bacterium]|nr:flagellar assembly protein FliX [Alphaproteobacteria bacterium]
MKIDPTGRVGAARIRRVKQANQGGSEAFAAQFDSEAEATAGSATTTVANVGGLLSLQEVSVETREESRAAAHGHNLLDRLDQIRHGLLLGAIPREDLERLAGLLREERAQVKDPKLVEILDEIELRAEVELAKYERR